MKLYLLGVLCLAVASFSSGAFGDDVSLAPPGTGWEEASGGRKNLKIYTRDVDGSDVKEVIMIGVGRFSPKQAFSVAVDYKGFPEFMPYVEYTQVVHTDKESDNRTVNYVFFYVKAPLVDARYYTLRLVDESDESIDGVAGSYRSKWDLVTDGLYHETPGSPDIQAGTMKDKTGIETTINQGYWLFQPADDGTKCKVSYYVLTNPGGSIPHWIANEGNSIALPAVWDALTKRINDPNYHK